MQNRTKIQEIAENRLAEAELLFQNGHYDGACYIVGYCIELALKATICKTLDIDNLFDPNGKYKAEFIKPFKTHNLADLLAYAGLKNKFEKDKIDQRNLISSWAYIKDVLKWSEEFRYQEIGTQKAEETQQLLQSVKIILQWIKKYW